MAPISASDAFFTVAVMSVTFLFEVGFFALIGIFRMRGKVSSFCHLA
jgi:hypothetical protein